MRHAVRCLAPLALLLLATPLLAQRRVDLFFDVEGARRAAKTEFVPNETRYVPSFDDGGGIGGGVNWYFSGRMSLELKVAGLASHLHVRRTGGDFVTVADLGNAQIYPITAVMQWHPVEHGTFRPYVGIGAAHVILRNIEKRASVIGDVSFDDPTGLVVDAGLQIPLGKRWSLTGDARYIPIETQARAVFAESTTDLDVRPLLVSFGLAYHF
ncbi:MAG TPA: OmpW family outer membrane protein [Thermoanaerobaculia bacterium]|nr:OmpW family outer membrane protein [Thermoanaerobaculia bacterium]